MKLKHTLAASSFILALSMAQSASAVVTFAFDPLGGGSTATLVNSIDQAPGSALAIGGVTAVQNFIANANTTGSNLSTQFTLAYQANLQTMSLNGTTKFVDGFLGAPSFNFVMQFQETVTSAVAANNSATFAFAPGGTNSFQMFTGTGNNLTGAGFGTGTSILSAHVISTPASNYVNSGNITTTGLDNFNHAAAWANTQSVIGSGSSSLILVLDSVNAQYFPDLNLAAQIAISFFNTSQVTPFSQVDPSLTFNWLAGGPHATNVGPINGLTGPDFIFQADGNQSLQNVPEPASLLLLGLGLAGLSLTRKRSI